MTCVLAALLASRSSGGAYFLLPLRWGTASTRPLSAQSDLGGLFIKYKYTDLFHLCKMYSPPEPLYKPL